jgi:hypothetical protein
MLFDWTEQEKERIDDSFRRLYGELLNIKKAYGEVIADHVLRKVRREYGVLRSAETQECLKASNENS